MNDWALLVVPEVTDENDGVTVTELVWFDVVTVQLGAISRLDITSMVLVEVIQLIVHVDWALNVVGDLLKIQHALALLSVFVVLGLQVLLAELIVLSAAFKDLLTEHVEYNTNGQENDTEDTESEHGAHGGGHGSPSWQCLLLELGLLEFLDLIPDPLLFFLIDVHLFIF